MVDLAYYDRCGIVQADLCMNHYIPSIIAYKAAIASKGMSTSIALSWIKVHHPEVLV